MKEGSGITMGCGGIICVFVAFAAVWTLTAWVLHFWTDSNLDAWASYAQGKEVDVKDGISFGVSYLVPLAIMFNIASLIARIVMGI